MKKITTDLYVLEMEPRGAYFYAAATGNIQAIETRVEVWKEIIATCRECGCDRLLVVQDSPGNQTAADAFTSSAKIAAIGLGGIRIAYADINPENHELNKFGELVAQNRGAAAAVFTTETDALAWLMSDEAP